MHAVAFILVRRERVSAKIPFASPSLVIGARRSEHPLELTCSHIGKEQIDTDAYHRGAAHDNQVRQSRGQLRLEMSNFIQTPTSNERSI
jgi:hypothetical protein